MLKGLRPQLLVVAALAVLGGCRENTVSIQPASLCAMPDDCTFSDTCSAQYIGTPMLDLRAAGADDMWLGVEIRNGMPNNADEASGRLNTHDAHFESYSLSYSGITPAVDPATITNIPSSGGNAQQFIPAEGNAVIGFEPFPHHVVNAIRTSGVAIPTAPDYDEVIVEVTFKGRLEDGSEWEVPYNVPVRLCQGCVPVGCEDATQVPVGACPQLFQLPRGAITCAAAP